MIDWLIDWLIDWCLIQTLVVFQLYKKIWIRWTANYIAILPKLHQTLLKLYSNFIFIDWYFDRLIDWLVFNTNIRSISAIKNMDKVNSKLHGYCLYILHQTCLKLYSHFIFRFKYIYILVDINVNLEYNCVLMNLSQ